MTQICRAFMFLVFLAVLPAAFAACGGSSGFAGGSPASATTGESSTAATAADTGTGTASATANSTLGSESSSGTTAGAVPASAITQGSFTVWANPTTPQPNQDYQIYVQVKLPAGTGNYSVADLTGQLVGTDGYHQKLGSAGRPSDQNFSVTGTTALLMVSVPGADHSGVNDTITIGSTLLGEQQTITLTFAGGSAGSGSGDGSYEGH